MWRAKRILFPRMNAVRRMFSTEEAARNARRSRLNDAASRPTSVQKPSPLTPKNVGLAVGVLAVGYSIYEVNTPGSVLAKLYEGSPLDRFFSWVMSTMRGVMIPTNEALLPDWPDDPCYGNPPPGTPAPPVLVIDLERTIIGSHHDAKHGWRHVKRPGWDKFLEQLSQYYEIAIISENDKNSMFEVLEAIDPQGRCHKFGSGECEIRDGIPLKRLDNMNRDMSRIIVIDDNPEAMKLFPRNAIFIKPYVDVYDTKDNALLRLVPLLQAMVHHDVRDFREVLDDMGTHNAEECVEEYEMRLMKTRERLQEKRNRGLGGVLRAVKTVDATSVAKRAALTSGKEDSPTSSSSSGPFSLSAVGKVTPEGKILSTAETATKAASKKKGGLFQMLEDSEKEKEEVENRKREKMNELYAQRMREKAIKDQEEAKKAARREE